MNLCRSGTVLDRAERVALCALRRALCGEVGTCTSLVCPFGLGRDGAEIQRIFSFIWCGACVPPPFCELSLWGAAKVERCLLRALAAVQVENTQLLEAYLSLFVSDSAVKQRLSVAMEALGATLAVHGYWLPQPLDALPIPASALMMARVRGQDLGLARVSWPG